MSVITVAGLGPGNPKLRTIETVEAIVHATQIILRTAIHPGVEDIARDPRSTACDDIYQSAERFDDVYAGVASRVIAAADRGDVLYLTPGHPRYGEHVTTSIESAAGDHEVVVLDAVSAFDATANALRADLMAREPQSIDATTLALSLERSPFSSGQVDLSPFRPVLVTQVYSREMAIASKLALSRVFGDEHEVTVIRGAGMASQMIQTTPLHRLDRCKVDHLTSLWIEPQPAISASSAFGGLLQIVAHLRAPGGCPWDREQTQTSMLPAFIEEAYEAVEAVQSGDHEHASEELGDVLLHIAMQAQMAEEAEFFTIDDVLTSITAKLIRRHPHVFGDEEARSAGAVIGLWQQVKASEKPDRIPKPNHPIDRYPAAMPIARRLHDTIRPSGIIGDQAALGDAIFEATKSAIEAGFDPEALLLEAARRAIPNDPVQTSDNP